MVVGMDGVLAAHDSTGKFDGAGERYAMLGNVRFVLGRIELGIHQLYVDTTYSECKPAGSAVKRTAAACSPWG